MNDTNQDKPRTLTPKRIKKPLGPFVTCHETFSKGMRQLIIERIDEDAIVYRLKGLKERFRVCHNQCFARSQAIDAGVDTGPRSGVRVKRGTTR